ncbi:MAG: Na/Pi symporter [Candidatus Aenigmarchaeota archaeon]|nr:Na/Pi symporter [Candidatus Aenigmarchaeota archaeon]
METLKKTLFLLLTLYSFLIGIKLIESAFKLFGSGFAEDLITVTTNPIVGLFIGILATSLMQSSSATTSIIVGLVAGGGVPIVNAIPMIMGANIGTTVTNTIVSMAHVRRREEFKLALSGATVHDFFNIIAVIILLPIEYFTHILEISATYLAEIFFDTGGITLAAPLKIAVTPVVNAISSVVSDSGPLMLILGLVILFGSLRYIVKIMKSLIMTKMEVFIDKYLFKTVITSFLVGAIFTALVQSSSVTTSLVVPLIGSGMLTVEKIFPYMIGANIGTTITAILASLVTASKPAVTIAFVHLIFNMFGIIILYPLKFIPIGISKKFAAFASEHRWVTIMYLIVAFYAIPLIVIIILR